MRPGRGQRVAAAGAVRRQPYPAMGAELPVRFDLAAAIAALVDQVAKLLPEFQECGFLSALLGLWLLLLFVHGVPSVFPILHPGDDEWRERFCVSICRTFSCWMCHNSTP